MIIFAGYDGVLIKAGFAVTTTAGGWDVGEGVVWAVVMRGG